MTGLKKNSLGQCLAISSRFDKFRKANVHYLLLRWTAQMSAIELHSVWERFAESRLIAALNHHPDAFIATNSIRGIKTIPVGLAEAVIVGPDKYFDFRNTSDLIKRAKQILSDQDNPFLLLKGTIALHLDTLSAIRNYIVHRSDYSWDRYRATLSSLYGITKAPKPDELLNALDDRKGSIAPRKPRLIGLITAVERAIQVA